MATGIAWWAHIGGFVCGIISLKFLNVLPDGSIAGGLKQASLKRKTSPRFQALKTPSGRPEPDGYQEIYVTPHEAAAGAKKMINIPWGFYNRFYNVTIPPGTRDGMLLRLKGAGPRSPEGHPGDLFLKVRVNQTSMF